jgi:hypothetical protein
MYGMQNQKKPNCIQAHGEDTIHAQGWDGTVDSGVTDNNNQPNFLAVSKTPLYLKQLDVPILVVFVGDPERRAGVYG